jgi:hypothetical protein
MWDMCICLDRDVWGKMITRLINDGLYIPYTILQSLSLMISIIISKMFVDKPVYKHSLNSLLWGLGDVRNRGAIIISSSF